MRMTLTERKLSPELERYVSRSMPECADISVIVNNLVAFGGFKDVAAARDALRWGSGPFVFPEHPHNSRCANASGHAKCSFDAKRPHWIQINMEDFDDWLNGRGTGFTAGGRPVPIIGVAMLHALCHWGNFRAGVTEPAEQGLAFERATYGRVIG